MREQKRGTKGSLKYPACTHQLLQDVASSFVSLTASSLSGAPPIPEFQRKETKNLKKKRKIK